MTKQNQPQSQGQDSKNTGQSGDAAQRSGAPNGPNRGNDPKNVQQTSKDQRESGKGREGVDAPRTEQGHQSGKKEQGAKAPPRYDDRPNQQRGGTDDTQSPGSALPKSGTPNYGDQEPGDPRRLDVDAGTGGRSTSTERKNPS